MLDNAEPELAVARGAVAYGLARRGVGHAHRRRLGAQLLPAAPARGRRRPAPRLCLLPRGAEEGEEITLKDRTFSLKLGQPVSFLLASSTGEAAYLRPGEMMPVDDELFHDLPPLAAVLDDDHRPTEPKSAPREAA